MALQLAGPIHGIQAAASTPSARARARKHRLSRDYLPAVDRFLLDWAKTPLGALAAAAVAAGLCGVFLHPHGFVILLAIILVVTLGLVWPWLSVRGLSARLSFSRTRSREGEEVTVRMAVKNRALWAASGLGVRFGPGTAPGRMEAAVFFVAGRAIAESRWTFTPRQRGEYPGATPHLTCGFPFGLWHASRPIVVDSPLLVWPRTFPVSPMPLTAGERSTDGAVFRNKAGTTGDLLGVRPYRRGDSLRRIHWPQTARHGRLVVCELQSPAHPLVQVVLDTEPAAHSGDGAESSREWAIRVAASFIEGWLQDGTQVEAIVGGTVFPGRVGPAQIPVLLDTLARLGPEQGPGLTALAELPAWKRYDGGLRVVITTDLALARAPAAVLHDPRQRFVVLRAAGFAEDADRARPVELPAGAWIIIERAADVPAALRLVRKEEAHHAS